MKDASRFHRPMLQRRCRKGVATVKDAVVLSTTRRARVRIAEGERRCTFRKELPSAAGVRGRWMMLGFVLAPCKMFDHIVGRLLTALHSRTGGDGGRVGGEEQGAEQRSRRLWREAAPPSQPNPPTPLWRKPVCFLGARRSFSALSRLARRLPSRAGSAGRCGREGRGCSDDRTSQTARDMAWHFCEHAPLLRLQGSERKFTTSREIEPALGSFCRHGSCASTEVARSVPSGPTKAAPGGWGGARGRSRGEGRHSRSEVLGMGHAGGPHARTSPGKYSVVCCSITSVQVNAIQQYNTYGRLYYIT